MEKISYTIPVSWEILDDDLFAEWYGPHMLPPRVRFARFRQLVRDTRRFIAKVACKLAWSMDSDYVNGTYNDDD